MLTTGIALILLCIIFFPCVNSATSEHKKSDNLDFTKDETVKKELRDIQPIDDDTAASKTNNLNNNIIENTGKIYGYTHCSHGVWTWDPIPYTWVRVGLRITRSDNRGYYELNNLPIDRTYRVIANRLGYLKTVNKVTLTQEKPEVSQYIDMDWIIEYIFDFF